MGVNSSPTLVAEAQFPRPKSMGKTTYQTSIPRLKNFGVAGAHIPRVQSSNVRGSVLRPTRSDWFVRLTFWISSPRWPRMTIWRDFTVVSFSLPLPLHRISLPPVSLSLSSDICCVYRVWSRVRDWMNPSTVSVYADTTTFFFLWIDISKDGHEESAKRACHEFGHEEGEKKISVN